MKKVDADPNRAPLDFSGRVVAITGAGRGVGREHALAFARRGAAVVVNDLGGSATGQAAALEGVAEQVAAEIRSTGGQAIADESDVADPDGGRRVVELALAEFGRLDVVVANAGIDAIVGTAEVTPELLARFLGVHGYGSLALAMAAWPHFVEQGFGRVITTTSSAGYWGLPRALPYAMAKGAVHALTQTLAAEGERHGITVNAVAPFAASRLATQRTGNIPTLHESIERHAPASAIAPVVLWLAHESTKVTGQDFEVGANAVARIFIAQAEGIFADELTPEIVRDAAAELMATAGFVAPAPAGADRPLGTFIAGLG